MDLYAPVVVRIARIVSNAKVVIECGDDTFMMRDTDFELMLAESRFEVD